jgi:hypothetical protein
VKTTMEEYCQNACNPLGFHARSVARFGESPGASCLEAAEREVAASGPEKPAHREI